MDYKKIYQAFISDRKGREREHLKAGVYTERHHIIPKCMSGTNSNDNLVRLTYRDHVFAHALLLKGAQDDWEKWQMAASMSAVLNFDGGGNRTVEERTKMDQKYSWARRVHGETVAGKNHPNYDHTRYTLYKNGASVSGTKRDLIELLGIDFRQVYDLCNGNRHTANGWSLYENKEDIPRKNKAAKYTIYHVDGRIFTGTRKEIEEQTCLGSRAAKALTTDSNYHHKGWCGSKEEAENRIETKQTLMTRAERYDGLLYHVNGHKIDPRNYKLKEMKSLGLDMKELYSIKKYGYAAGWCVDKKEAELRALGVWRPYGLSKYRAAVSFPFQEQKAKDEFVIYDDMARPVRGTIKELQKITGLSYSGVRDIAIYDRRDSAGKYFSTFEKAMNGKPKRGPRKKVQSEEFFGDSL